MKNLLPIFLLFIFIISCKAQDEKLLLRQELIENFSDYPGYNLMTEEKDGKVKWKKRFSYMDKINMYAITYLSDGLKINGLMVKPKKEGNYPCVIFNRGGNREFGAWTIHTGSYFLGQIAKEGYVVIASQYRGNGLSEGQEEFGGKDVNDVTILPEVLQEVEGANTDKIGMYGWSRGGMMTYLALTKMKEIKVAIVGGAVSDYFDAIKNRPNMEKVVYGELIPNYVTNKETELKKRSAIYWADQFPKNVPILLLHGNADWRVKSVNSLKLALEFEKYRVPYRLVIYEGGDHGIREHRKEVDAQVIAWLDKYLKNEAPLPNMEYHGK